MYNLKKWTQQTQSIYENLRNLFTNRLHFKLGALLIVFPIAKSRYFLYRLSKEFEMEKGTNTSGDY